MCYKYYRYGQGLSNREVDLLNKGIDAEEKASAPMDNPNTEQMRSEMDAMLRDISKRVEGAEGIAAALDILKDVVTAVANAQPRPSTEQREPLLSDAEMEAQGMEYEGNLVRKWYEAKITSGELAVVKKGTWSFHKTGGDMFMRCSVCDRSHPQGHYPHCSFCGSLMQN